LFMSAAEQDKLRTYLDKVEHNRRKIEAA